jgi:uncharacterized protein YkwD
MTVTRLTALVGLVLAALLLTAASSEAASPDRGAHAAAHRHAAVHRHADAKRHHATARKRHARKRRAAARRGAARPVAATPASAPAPAPSPTPAAACPDTATQPTGANAAAISASVLCLVNAERAGRGLVALTDDARLATAAAGHAQDMVARGFFAHTTPDGVDFSARIRAAGYRDELTVAENLAWGSGVLATPAEIVRAWMASPGHRANILDGTLRESGIGVVVGAPTAGVADAATYAQEFGRR